MNWRGQAPMDVNQNVDKTLIVFVSSQLSAFFRGGKNTNNRGRYGNKVVYTAISVACGWTGAVMSICKPRNSENRDRK